MKILSVLVLCTVLFACTKPKTEVLTANPETPISNPLQLTDSDSLVVDASVTEYPEGVTSRWKVDVYMSRFVEEPVNVTVEWTGPLGPVSFNAIINPGEREHRFITNFTTPINSSAEDVRVTNAYGGTPELIFVY
jgi:hypothetical protein